MFGGKGTCIFKLIVKSFYITLRVRSNFFILFFFYSIFVVMHKNIKKDKNCVCDRFLLQVHMIALCYVEITTFKNISHPTVGSGSLPDKVIPSWNPILAPTQGKIYLVFVTFIIIRISSHKYHFIIRAFLYICQIILWTNKSNQPKSIYHHSTFIRTKFLYNRTRTTCSSLIIPSYPITGIIIQLTSKYFL